MKNKMIYKSALINIFILFIISTSCTNNSSKTKEYSVIKMADTKNIKIKGIIGHAIDISENGRLSQFINSPESDAIKIFSHENQESNGSWKGEHAGKWLYAASKAAYRSNNENLKKNVLAVADFLISQQLENGYIGTYVDTTRFYANPVKPRQTWDVWISAYIMQGFIEVYKHQPEEKYLDAAKKIANLMINTFINGNKILANSGCFSGMASDGIMENFVDLYNITKDKKYLQFAKHCAYDLNNRPGTEIINRSLNKIDVAQIGEGKMYEMLRCYVGFAKLYQITKNDTFLQVINNAWDEIHDRHLSPLGAPWGGIHQHKECFNFGYMFSPYGFSETCAMMDWFRFTKEMYKITGDNKYVNELEKTIYNGILGAQFSDGLTWTYHSRPNGERTKTGEWACCSSSGTVILEEVPEIIYSLKANGIAINIFSKSSNTINLNENIIKISQETNYPWNGKVKINITQEENINFPVYIRIPDWAKGSEIIFNKMTIKSEGNEYVKIELSQKDNLISVNIPLKWQVINKTNEYSYQGYYIDGIEEYFYLKRGPVVYAADIEDQLEKPTSERFNPNKVIELLKEKKEVGIPVFELKERNIKFSPFFMADKRKAGNFKSTWLRIK